MVIIDKYNLTERELEVLSLLIQGYSNEVMSEKLIVSIHTVKSHIESIYQKLSVHNKVQAAVFAVKNNIVNIDTIL